MLGREGPERFLESDFLVQDDARAVREVQDHRPAVFAISPADADDLAPVDHEVVVAVFEAVGGSWASSRRSRSVPRQDFANMGRSVATNSTIFFTLFSSPIFP